MNIFYILTIVQHIRRFFDREKALYKCMVLNLDLTTMTLYQKVIKLYWYLTQ